MTPPLLQVENLRKTYGGNKKPFTAVDDISFALKGGEILGLLGPNGSGKTISWCLPTTYIFEGMRQILSSHIFPTSYFWISMALNLIYLAAALALFRAMFEKSRAKGLARME